MKHEALIVISASIKGLLANKASILSELCKKKKCLCLHETHISADYARLKIDGMNLVGESPHNKYASAIFIRKDLKVNSNGIVIHSVYKPQREPFVPPALGHRNLSHIVIGEFNSHSTT